MVCKLDFDKSPAFVALRNHFESEMKRIGLEFSKDEKWKVFCEYGDNDFEVCVSDWYLINQGCFVFFVPDIEDVHFERCEYVYSEEPSFLFVDKRFNIKFYDAESLSWNEEVTEKGTKKRYCADAYATFVNKCSKCGKITLVNSVGSYHCRACEHHVGDHDLEGDLLDLIPLTRKDYREKFLKDFSHNYIDNCREEIKSHKEKYDEYIASDSWKEKRQEVFAIQGHQCSICGALSNLRVHHMNYDNLFHEEDNQYSDLIVLCDDCHTKLHDFIKDHKEEIDNLKIKLITTKSDCYKYYKEKFNDTFYEGIKDIFEETDKKHATIIPYLKTIWGLNKFDTTIEAFVSAQNLYCKLKNEGKLK